ncbi:hypothetical protein [Fulvivirga imtechensis]|uniref:hypothetical protein n=1 Tax=Fulvivirga imtechensis TaxID=881893 RepID=UPI0003005BE2|nr:hypothetical protein [Fulvivirga imtechensis]
MKKSLIFSLLILCGVAVHAQKRSDQQPVTYEELYDEPYAINALFVQFQPIYGELWKANVNAGFGLEATYFLKDQMSFRAHARKTYTRKFDLTRDIAHNNSDVDNQIDILNYFEFGATYHIKDFEESSKTKMYLYKKSYKGDKWAARVPINAEIPCKVRKIYGARLGGMFFDTAIDVGRALEAQDETIAIYTDQGLPATVVDNGEEREINIFTSMDVKGLYVGGSMSWIRNVAVDFDNKYQEGVDDLILTAFFDVLIAPAITVDDVLYQGTAYSSEDLKTSMIGFRAGLDGKFNRTLSWGYGGEVGIRPGLKGQGFYALVKISFPVYSTNLDYSVEAFGK